MQLIGIMTHKGRNKQWTINEFKKWKYKKTTISRLSSAEVLISPRWPQEETAKFESLYEVIHEFVEP